MDLSKVKISWPTVAALAVVAVALLVAYLAGPALGVPEESHTAFVAGLGAVGALVLAAARQMLGLADPEDPDATPPNGTPLLVLALVLSAVTQGCGGSVAQQHARVNILTDVADPTYELALAGCDEARNLIVARADSTEAEDRADMDAVNLACDGIVNGFELLRGSQLTARQAIDDGLSGAAEELLRQGMAQWEHLRELAAGIGQATSGGES